MNLVVIIVLLVTTFTIMSSEIRNAFRQGTAKLIDKLLNINDLMGVFAGVGFSMGLAVYLFDDRVRSDAAFRRTGVRSLVTFGGLFVSSLLIDCYGDAVKKYLTEK